MSEYECPVCDTKNPGLAWTDFHGVAQCFVCGAPARVLHYDDDNKRVDKPPTSIIASDWVPRLRAFREETGCRIPSGCSFPGGQELATPSDIQTWNEWVQRNHPEPETGGNE